MKYVAILICSALYLASLKSVESKPQPGLGDSLGTLAGNLGGAVSHAAKNYCEPGLSEQFCGPRLFYWCDGGRTGGKTSKMDNTCRYTGAFYGFVLGIPALVIILIVVGVVVFMKSKQSSGM